MSLLAELNALADKLGIPIETGVFTGTAPDEYLILTPLADSFALHADDQPQYDVQEVRISLYAKGSYLERRDQIIHALLAADIDITDRRYIGHEDKIDGIVATIMALDRAIRCQDATSVYDTRGLLFI